MYSVIMPYYNHWDLTHARLQELRMNLPDENEICLVNDCSPDDDTKLGAAWWQKSAARHSIKHHYNKTNLGFGGSMNYGANKMAVGDRLVFLSNDVEVHADFTKELDTLFDAPTNSNGKLIGAELLTYYTGWNNLKEWFAPYVNGWFLACTKEDWKKLGGFDPRYGKFDYEDVDLSMTALSLGFELIGMNKPRLIHLGGQTVRMVTPDRQKLTIMNRIKFVEKWEDNCDFLADLVLEPRRVYKLEGTIK